MNQPGNHAAGPCTGIDITVHHDPWINPGHPIDNILEPKTASIVLVSKTFGIGLSAKLHLWGPPFGGIAHVSWWVISFDIYFGDPKKTRPGPIDWDEFHRSFLPQPDNAANAGPQKDPVINTIGLQLLVWNGYKHPARTCECTLID